LFVTIHPWPWTHLCTSMVATEERLHRHIHDLSLRTRDSWLISFVTIYSWLLTHLCTFKVSTKQRLPTAVGTHMTYHWWYMTHDSWLMTHDSWLMTHDSWPMTHDSWLMTHDSWLIAFAIVYAGQGSKRASCPTTWGHVAGRVKGTGKHYSCIYLFDMTHSYVWHDSFICVTWLIHMCDMTHSLVRLMWSIHTCDMTHSFICVTWLMHSFVWWLDPIIRVTWLIHMCDMIDLYVWHVSFIHLFIRSINTCDMTHSFICVTWLIHMCDMTRPYWRRSHEYR